MLWVTHAARQDLLLRVLRTVIEEGVTLSTLASIFDKLNAILQTVPEDGYGLGELLLRTPPMPFAP